MKRIINNKLYDTDKAKELVKFGENVSHASLFCNITSAHDAIIYKTNKGNYLKYVGPNNDYPNYKTLDLLATEEVKKILIQINAIDAYETEFGKLEEGQGQKR